MEANKGLGYIDAQLTDVEAWDGSTSFVNPGEYILRAEKVEGGQSKAGKPKMVVTYIVVEALAEANADQVGRSIVQSYSLDLTNDTVLKRLKSVLTGLGVPLDQRGGFDASALIGCEMLAEVVSETFTEPNPLTREPVTKNTTKVIRERVPQDAAPAQEAAPAPAPAPAPAATAQRGRRNAAPPVPRAS